MIPKDLLYAKSHEWCMVEGDVATVGITQFAQEQLGDLTFVNARSGDTFEAGSEWVPSSRSKPPAKSTPGIG